MKSTSLLLRAQKCWRMGRVFSSVSGFALEGSAAGGTQMLSTPSRGAIHEIHLPSGLTRPCALVGLPKKSARGMSSTPGACAAAPSEASESAAAAALRSVFATDMENASGLESCDAHDL